MGCWTYYVPHRQLIKDGVHVTIHSLLSKVLRSSLGISPRGVEGKRELFILQVSEPESGAGPQLQPNLYATTVGGAHRMDAHAQFRKAAAPALATVSQPLKFPGRSAPQPLAL